MRRIVAYCYALALSQIRKIKNVDKYLYVLWKIQPELSRPCQPEILNL